MFESLNGKKYGLIYADPPWTYKSFTSKSRDVGEKYSVMDYKDIAKMPVQGISKQNCILYLWATAPKLTEAGFIMESWGFEYITCAIWDKKSMGMGWYFRIQHEILMIGRKGKIKAPSSDVRIRSIITQSKTSKHSEKPKLHFLLDSYHPELNKIELFARDRELFNQHWDFWGNEV